MPALEKIRVVIVDDIAETRDNLKRMLQFDNSIEVIAEARTGREGIEVANQQKPDVVLMDINMPDMDGITATEAIRKKVPYTQVVILSVQVDSNYMRRAMLAGARDFLTKPPIIDELTAAIRRAGTMAHEERQKSTGPFTTVSGPGGTQVSTPIMGKNGKIIVIYSPKGGTGRTTIATNLAIALQSSEKTCLVDGSLQFGDVAVFLNEQGKNTILDLAPRVDELDPDIVQEVMVSHAATGLHVLAAPPRPEYSEDVTGEQFTKLLQYLRQMYAYIVVDTATYLTETVQSALDIADLIILLTTQDIPAIKSINLFLGIADATGINRKRILFVMNKYDKKIAITPEKVGESLRQEISLAIPFEERIVSFSVNKGVPFVVDQKATPVARSIYSLADLCRQRIDQMAATEIDTPARR
ncbi:response regulator [bacterium]|nr:MAG: response regulator [bacterium]